MDIKIPDRFVRSVKASLRRTTIEEETKSTIERNVTVVSEGTAVQTSQHLHGREQVITKRKIVKCVDSLHSIHIN
jgi:hypothetical protein